MPKPKAEKSAKPKAEKSAAQGTCVYIEQVQDGTKKPAHPEGICSRGGIIGPLCKVSRPDCGAYDAGTKDEPKE